MSMRKIVAIIPARYASVRFAGKPLARIGDRTMIERVWERASSVFSDVLVATDHRRIYEHVVGFGGKVVMTSDEHKSGTDRVAEAVSLLGFVPDIVVNVQGDEPFISVDSLRKLVELFEDENCDIASLVQPFSSQDDIYDPNSVKAVLNCEGYALYFSRSAIPYMRNLPKEEWSSAYPFYKHIGLYGYRFDALQKISKMAPSQLELAEGLEQLRWLENSLKIRCAISKDRCYGIDTLEELQNVVKLLESGEKL